MSPDIRRKTDRGVGASSAEEIDRGLRLAETAVPPKSKLYVQAERGYLMSESWLRLISDLDRDECRELGLRLKGLRTLLERLRIQDK